MENAMSSHQPTTIAQQIALQKEAIDCFTQSIKSKQEQIRLLQEQINKDQSAIVERVEKIKELELQQSGNQFVNIATNQNIPTHQIIPNIHKSAWYYGNRMTEPNVPLKPIFTFPDNKGSVKFYAETPCVKVKLSELQVGDIIKHNFSDYYRELPNYCVVVKITDKQVQFQPYKKYQVGYEGDQHSFNSYWFKFVPTLDSEAKPYKMNKSSSWKKVISENTIDKYVGEPNNMYADRKYDGGA